MPEDPETARMRFAKAAKRLLGEHGPMKAGEIFTLVKKSLKRSFFPRQTQQLLRWARDKGLGFDQLKDRRWRLVEQADPAARRVAPSRKTTEMRRLFGKAAVKAIRTAGRPLGAEEIWDRAKPRPTFVRRNAANVLPLVDHPDLIRTPDGSWAVREWMAALPPRTASYHSRVRSAIYPVLGADVLRILRTNRPPHDEPRNPTSAARRHREGDRPSKDGGCPQASPARLPRTCLRGRSNVGDRRPGCGKRKTVP